MHAVWRVHTVLQCPCIIWNKYFPKLGGVQRPRVRSLLPLINTSSCRRTANPQRRRDLDLGMSGWVDSAEELERLAHIQRITKRHVRGSEISAILCENRREAAAPFSKTCKPFSDSLYSQAHSKSYLPKVFATSASSVASHLPNAEQKYEGQII